MRWLPVSLAVVLACSTAGCAGAFEQAFDPASVCHGDSVFLQNQSAAVLLSDQVPVEVRESFGQAARATIHVEKGQAVTLVVQVDAVGGQVKIAYDGPGTNTADVPSTYVTRGYALAAGNVTAEVFGDPFAAGVGYSILLQAAGCPTTEVT